MQKSMLMAGLPSPEISADSFFTIKFRRLYSEKLGVKLGVNEQGIMAAITENKFVTIGQLADKLGISTTAVEKNFIKRMGSDKTGYWAIVKK